MYSCGNLFTLINVNIKNNNIKNNNIKNNNIKNNNIINIANDIRLSYSQNNLSIHKIDIYIISWITHN